MTELSPLVTWEEGGEGEKGWFSWTKVCYYSLLHVCLGSFLFPKDRMLQGCAVVAQSEDGVAYERVTFPLGHSCSELLFSF